MLKRATRLLLLLPLAMPGCGRSDAAPEMNRYETVPVSFVVEMSGDVNVSYQGTVTAHFVARRVKDDGEVVSAIVGAQPAEPIKHEGIAFVAGAAVVGFAGNGTYEIPAGSPQELLADAQKRGAQPEATSSIEVAFWPSGNTDEEPESYPRRVKPCTAVIEKLGSQGTVSCPDVTDEAGEKHFSFRLRWVAPAQPAPMTTLPSPSETVP